jgi:hypothetical protein
MKKTGEYSDAPREVAEALDRARMIGDFLPPPGELVLREATQKVTIALSRKSIGFFKEAARQARVPYQKLIRRVLDLYAEHNSTEGPGGERR